MIQTRSNTRIACFVTTPFFSIVSLDQKDKPLELSLVKHKIVIGFPDEHNLAQVTEMIKN